MLYQIFNRHVLFLLIHRTESYSPLHEVAEYIHIHIKIDMTTEGRVLVRRLAMQGK